MSGCPLVPGLHGWVWPGGHGEGWLTAREQALRAVDLGLVGVIAQNGLSAPRWLAGLDPGESLIRADVLRLYGLQVTAGFGLDGDWSATTMAQAISDGGSIADACMLDWEKQTRWETKQGRALAQATVDLVLKHDSTMNQRTADAPWWKPSVHKGAPTLIWDKLARYHFVQAYGAPSRDNPTEITEWMYHSVSLVEYPALGIPAERVLPAEQMYGHSIAAAGRLVLADESVVALWDVEEADDVFVQALHARKAIRNLGYPTTLEGLRLAQAALGTKPDGILGPKTLAALGIH